MQARWGSEEAWTVLATNIAGHSFSDTLYRAAGQDTLFVGVRGNTDVLVDTVLYVGVGDIFVIAGQSNASGHADNNQSYSHPTLKAAMFGNDYQWKEMSDPTDSYIGQIDVVSNDMLLGAVPEGSIWPIIVDSIMANYNIPVGLIPCAAGGSTCNAWRPATNHLDRTTLYGSMHFRVDSVGGAKAVLFWQGEQDAKACVPCSSYNARLDDIADNIQADMGIKIMPVLLERIFTATDACQDTIRAAVTQAWTDNANVLVGPDFEDIEADNNGAHVNVQAKIDSCANRFWRKIRDNIYTP